MRRLLPAIAMAATLLLLPTASPAHGLDEDLLRHDDWQMNITADDGEVEILCMVGTEAHDVVGGALTTVVRDCHLGSLLKSGTGQMRTTFTNSWLYETAILTDERQANARTDLSWDAENRERTSGGAGFNRAWSADYLDMEVSGKSSAICHVPDDPFVTLICRSTDDLGPTTTWKVALHAGFVSVMSETPGMGWNVAWMRSQSLLGGILDHGSRGDLLGRPPWENR